MYGTFTTPNPSTGFNLGASTFSADIPAGMGSSTKVEANIKGLGAYGGATGTTETPYGTNKSGVHGPSSDDFSKARTRRTQERVSASRGQVGFFTNLIDEDGAEFLARRVLQFYDVDKNGHIDAGEIKAILKDIYKIIGRTYEPTEKDVKELAAVLDKNNDGIITAEDIETCALKYLKTDHYAR